MTDIELDDLRQARDACNAGLMSAACLSWRRDKGSFRLCPPLVHRRPHLGDRCLKTDEDRLADQKMTDVELDDFRQARDDLGRGKIEPVARVTFEPLAAGEHSRCLDADEFPGGALALVMRE